MKLFGAVHWYDVARACIDHGWYTHGTNNDYAKLAENVMSHYDVNLADENNAWYVLTSFADDIKVHSETEYSVEDIAQVLLNCVCWRFVD